MLKLFTILLAMSSTPVPDSCDALDAAEAHERGETDDQCGSEHVCAFVVIGQELGEGNADDSQECVPSRCAEPGEVIELEELLSCLEG